MRFFDICPIIPYSSTLLTIPVAVPDICLRRRRSLASVDRCHSDSLRAALWAVARLHGACGRTSLRSLLPPQAALPSLPCCFHISFSFTDVGIRIPTGASALGMTHRNDSRSDYQRPLSLRASARTGVAIRSSTIILQITLRVCKLTEIIPQDLLFPADVIESAAR